MLTQLHDFTVVSIPTTTNFRGINYREAALFRGEAGWSEFSPFLEYGAEESATWLKAAFEAAHQPWPELKRSAIPINATLPRVSPDRVSEILKFFPGCTTIKIKVDSFEADRELVAAALAYNPEAKIRIDVNGGWSREAALVNLSAFHNYFGEVFEYVEQPCDSLVDLADVKKRIPIKIAADEAIRKNLGSDFSALSEIADVAIVKWAPSGGITAARKLISEIGLPAVISSALDTGIGISHGLALAASLDQLDFACGLGTVALLESDICDPAVIVRNGAIDVARMVPTPALLAKYRAADDRQEWWKNRVAKIIDGGWLG